MKLFARVVGNPTPQVTWLKNNQPLETSPRVKMTFDGENIELTIKDADSETDTGNYKCIASNSVGKASHGAKITVDVDTVKFTKKLKKTYTVTERKTLTMECETSHTITTKWYHNDKEITGTDHRVVIQDGKVHKLVIKKTTLKDYGSYKCTVKDQKTETEVVVEEMEPEFVRRLHDIEVTERETGVLEVEITSSTVNVEWKKDGLPIDTKDDKYVVQKEGGIRRLIVRNITIHDEGEYTCILIDEESTAEVTVIELPPEIMKKLKDQTVSKGEKAMFEIELTKGDALVHWFKDGEDIQFSEHIQLAIDGKRQKLKIYNTELEDAGIFSCEVGMQKSTARLSVYEPSLSFLRKLPEKTGTPKNTDVELIVELSRSDVDVQWLRDGKPIKPSDKYKIITEENVRKLIIKNVQESDEVEYVCVAEDIQTFTRLVAEERPSPPQAPLEVTGMTATSFTLNWQPSISDGGSPIVEYIVEIREKTEKEYKKYGSTKGKDTFLSINYLIKDHGYNFRIYARNVIGLSEPFVPPETIVAGSRLSK